MGVNVGAERPQIAEQLRFPRREKLSDMALS
jgi:hypothetical protein